MSEHQAVFLNAPGQPFELGKRPTPTPGPQEILIQAKAIALNPVDVFLRATGFILKSFPNVVGSDVAGLVVSTGSEVPANAPQPGNRVLAIAPSFVFGHPNYGAFQEYVLVPYYCTTTLPDWISFAEASTIPMAVQTAWTGFYNLGISQGTHYAPEDKKGILIWGGASSVGTVTIQAAKSLGLTIYATASPQHHDYLKSLGATKVFDYHAENVEETIINEIKADGINVKIGYLAVGPLKPNQEILKALNAGTGKSAILVSAPRVPETAPQVNGVTVKFVALPQDMNEAASILLGVFYDWLKKKLESHEYIPSPKVRLLDGGLGGIQCGLDILSKGVSGEKLVLEL